MIRFDECIHNGLWLFLFVVLEGDSVARSFGTCNRVFRGLNFEEDFEGIVEDFLFLKSQPISMIFQNFQILC